MTHTWVIIVIAVLVAWALKSGRIKADVSVGNPNYPTSQSRLDRGPQGPNDGSNNYMGNGHYANAW